MKSLVLILCLGISTLLDAQNSWLPVGNLNRHVYEFFTDTVSSKLFVGGDFTSFDNDTTRSVFTWNGTNGERVGCGSGWDCITPINQNNGSAAVRSVLRFGGIIYLTGDISTTSNITLNGIGSFDDSIWQNLGTGLKTRDNYKGRGFGLKVLNNELYVMGGFDSCAGIAARSIAKFNGTNWSNVYNFPPLSVDSANFVYDAEIYKGELYVAGNFYDPNNFNGPLWNIIKYNGIEWVPVSNGIKGGVSKLQVFKDDLYVCGSFRNTIEGNPPTSSLARWNGTEWLPIGGDLIYTNNPPILTDMLVYKDRLYITGLFNSLGGVETNGVAFWDGVNWNSFNNTTIDIETIGAIEVYLDTLYIGGNFRAIDGDSSMAFIAKWAGGDTILESGNTTTISEPEKKNFVIYPNPTNNIFNIKFNELFSGSIVITDISGRLLKSESFNDKTQITLSLEPYSNGIYFVSVINQNKVNETVRIVKL